jgi:hypothetical protein
VYATSARATPTAARDADGAEGRGDGFVEHAGDAPRRAPLLREDPLRELRGLLVAGALRDPAELLVARGRPTGAARKRRKPCRRLP